MRLSRKASEAVSSLTAAISKEIRRVAAFTAHNEGEEFASVRHVEYAAKQVLPLFANKCMGCGGTGVWEREQMPCPICSKLPVT